MEAWLSSAPLRGEAGPAAEPFINEDQNVELGSSASRGAYWRFPAWDALGRPLR